MENKLATIDKFDSLEALKTAKSFMDELKDSDLMNNFKVVNSDGKQVVSVGDAMAAIVMGAKLGIDPITSLSIGKELKGSKIYAIDKGVSLGLTPLEAMKMVHSIPNGKGGTTLYTGINVITRQIIKSGTVIEILKDYVPVYSYYVIKNKQETKVDADRVLDEDGKLLDRFLLIDITTTQAEVDAAKADDKLFVVRKLTDYETRIRFTRDSTNTTIELSYFRSRAIKAGLIKQVDSKGSLLQPGKPNWNYYEEDMMRNRVISTGGRIIASDYLGGVYDYQSEVGVDTKNVEDIDYKEV